MIFNALAAHSAKALLQPHTFDPGPLAEGDVQIRVTHCGVCHSDASLVDNDWGNSLYPLIPGHEVVGIIEETSGHANGLQPGMRVGVGWQASSCGHCGWCCSGHDNLCNEARPTCVGHAGGFADRLRVSSAFAFPLPKALASPDAAPLLCAGITVYAPLRRFISSPAMHVGVIGVGGLGHIAIQFAKALGCEITAYTTSPAKTEEAHSLGAHRVVVTQNNAAFTSSVGSLDLILNTTSANLPWAAYLQQLRPNGTLCLVGVPPSNMNISGAALISDQKSVVGSNTGGRGEIIEMLELAARHNIRAIIEELPFEQANEALDRVRTNRARYRTVLHMPDA